MGRGLPARGAMVFGEHTPAALGVGQPLFFTNPASEVAREDITLKMSQDGAASWSTVHLVQKGCGMYSSVLQFPDGSVGVQWDDAHGGPISHAGLANGASPPAVQLSRLAAIVSLVPDGVALPWWLSCSPLGGRDVRAAAPVEARAVTTGGSW